MLAFHLEIEEQEPSSSVFRRECKKLKPFQPEITRKAGSSLSHTYEKDLKDDAILKAHKKFLVAVLEAESQEKARKACERTLQHIRADVDDDELNEDVTAGLVAIKL